MSRPTPKAWPSPMSVDEVARHKRVDCAHYVRCLDLAAAVGWGQFHCGECRAYTPHADDPTTQALIKLGRALAAAVDDDGTDEGGAT